MVYVINNLAIATTTTIVKFVIDIVFSCSDTISSKEDLSMLLLCIHL